MRKQLIIYIVLAVIGITLLNIIFYIQESTPRISDLRYIYISVLCVFFGILIEWRKVVSIITSGVKVNWLIIPATLLLINAILGFGFSATLTRFIFGTSINVPILAPLLSEPSRSVIFVFTGILLVRSLSKKLT